MAIAPTYPGVYIDELPSAVRTITGVPTSIAAFVGWAPRGPATPVRITSFVDYQKNFGGLHPQSPMSYAVYQFYQNGGSEAQVVRLVGGSVGDGNGGSTPPSAATITLPGSGGNSVTLTAVSSGVWGANLRARVDYATKDTSDNTLYNLTVFDPATGSERYLNVSTDATSARSLDKVLASSTLVTVTAGATVRPTANADVPAGTDPFGADGVTNNYCAAASGGADGDPTPQSSDYIGGNGDNFQRDKLGIYALLRTDIFNMLCLPGAEDLNGVLDAALALSVDRRAMLLVDPP